MLLSFKRTIYLYEKTLRNLCLGVNNINSKKLIVKPEELNLTKTLKLKNIDIKEN